jgi:hypothetical protein
MARSLTIQHEETVSTTPLLNGFLALSFLVLLVSGMSWDDAEATDATVDEAPAELINRP